MKEGTIAVGGITYVWDLEERKRHPRRPNVPVFELKCNGRPVGTVRDHREFESREMAGWYGEPSVDQLATTFGPCKDLESLIRKIIAHRKEIATRSTIELDAFASDPQGRTFDVFIGGTNKRIGRIVQRAEDWAAYRIDEPTKEPAGANSLKQALEALAR